jgi:ABC-type phosphate transport system substrate-binding protein
MTALHHPALVPLLVAAIIVVAVGWVATALSGWRRISWRDHMDTALNPLPRQVRRGAAWSHWKVITQQQEVENPSLVLLRVRNSGFAAVKPEDFRRPLSFTFPGRHVREFTVTDCHGVTREMIQPPFGAGTAGPRASITDNRIYLPKFSLPRRGGFKLLVLLSGTERGVLGKGRIRRGTLARETLRRGPLARTIAFGVVLAVLLGTQAGITFGRAPVLPSFCAKGNLLVEGSTAFAPVAQQLSHAYLASCPGTSITVSGIATFNGLNAVNSGAGPSGTQLIAMSDGPAPAGYKALTGHPVAVMIFAVVVNRKTGAFNLTVPQIRGIFDGTITNWQQVDGVNQPIAIVARAAGSGTRRAFDSTVLGADEPAFSSYDCMHKDAGPRSAVLKCEVGDTTTLLQRVSAINGAIGYAQVGDAEPYLNVQTVILNGWGPGIGAVKAGVYPFWVNEYLYTRGSPARDTLAARFLQYASSDDGSNILRSEADTPCAGQSLPGSLCRG